MKAKAIKILECGADCLAKYGIGATNAQKIADELGIPQSSVFYYFATNQVLFSKMVQYIVERNHQMLADLSTKIANLDPKKALAKHVTGNLKWSRANPSHVAVLMYCYLEAKAQPELGKATAAALQAGQQRIYELLAVGVAEGVFKPRLPLKALAEIIHKALASKIIEVCLLPQGQSLSKQTKQDEEFAECVISLAGGSNTP